MDYGPQCGYCQRKSKEKGVDPPCITCRVDPLEENKAPIDIFFRVRFQLIMGSNGPVDLNHLAIEAAMRREGIEGKACFDKVCALGRWWIERIREKKD